MKNIVEIGKKFNKLTVISDNGIINGQRNVNGNYEPSNCKWSTQSEQCKNKRPIERE